MAFRVVPENLDHYANQVGRAAGDAIDAKRYVEQYADIGGGNGQLWDLASPAHQKAVTAVTGALIR